MSRNTATEHHRTASEPPFDATAPAATLDAALAAVDALVGECVLQVRPDGLAVDAQDPASVAMVALEVPADAFEAYEAGETALGVDLDRLRSVVGMADRGEPVRLALDPETRTLRVRLGELSYTLGLVDPDAIRTAPDIGDLSEQFTAAATVEGRAFAQWVAAADMVSEHLALGVDAEDRYLYASADGDTDAVRIEHPDDDCVDFEAGDAHSLFSVSYLDAVAGVVPPDAHVRLRLGEDAPAELAFDHDGGSVRYLVAPRMQMS